MEAAAAAAAVAAAAAAAAARAAAARVAVAEEAAAEAAVLVKTLEARGWTALSQDLELRGLTHKGTTAALALRLARALRVEEEQG